MVDDLAAVLPPDLSDIDDVRNTALQFLTVCMRGDASLDALLDRELRGAWDDADKQLLYTISTGVLRWMAKLDWVLNGFYHGEYLKCLPQMKNALRIALYGVMFMPNEPPEEAIAFAESFIGALKGEDSAATARGVLSHISHSIEHIRYPDKRDDVCRYASVIGSHPWWLAKRWIERFGVDEAMRLMLANNEPPPVTLRINRLNVELKHFLELLQTRGITYTPSTISDACVMIDTVPSFRHLETYKKGWFTPYTQSCALAVALLDPQPQESILSVCAGTSGKTMHMAEVMLNTGKITAVERIDARCAALAAEAARLGLVSIATVAADPLEIEAPIADRVLVDAPNSRLGEAARHPMVKWKCTAEQVRKFGGHQLALLMHAAKFVKPGGALVYTTHSTEPEENEDVVNHFLDASPRFAVEAPGRQVPKDYVTREGFVRTWPQRDRIEASFAVRFIRHAAVDAAPPADAPARRA